jgi:hypothetical protein
VLCREKKLSQKNGLPHNFNAGSISALYCEMFLDSSSPNPVANGTAFLGYCNLRDEQGGCKAVLLTARHNITGRDHFQPERFLSPNYSCSPALLRVYFPKIENPLEWFSIDFPLEQNKWIEHPERGSYVDVVGFQLSAEILKKNHEGCFVCLYSDSQDDIYLDYLKPSSSVHVIGFPMKRKENYLAVWSGGTIAYEPKLSFSYLDNDGSESLLPAYLW